MTLKYLYLDTANINHIRQYVKTDAIAGVTTNPSLMAKEEKGVYIKKLVEICEIIEEHASSRKHLSVEVTTLDPHDMCMQALTTRDALKGYSKIDLYIKIPIAAATLPVITRLADHGVKVNATAAMNLLQAKLAEDAGARIVSFFYNRMLDRGIDADREINNYIHNFRRSPLVICGSIRKAVDVQKCWMAGSDIVTASVKVIEEMAFHPGTEEAINQFQKDIDAWLS